VLFNGSLQFFADVPHTLAQAARLLRAGESSACVRPRAASPRRRQLARRLARPPIRLTSPRAETLFALLPSRWMHRDHARSRLELRPAGTHWQPGRRGLVAPDRSRARRRRERARPTRRRASREPRLHGRGLLSVDIAEP
jgi:hypothetical protein